MPDVVILSKSSPIFNENPRCAYCQTVFRPGDRVVRCPNCQTAHHEQCWGDSGNACAVFNCPGAGSIASSSDRLEVEEATVSSIRTERLPMPKPVPAKKGTWMTTAIVAVVVAFLVVGAFWYAYDWLKELIVPPGPAPVSQINRDPVVNITVDRTSVTEGEQITFIGSASDPEDGDVSDWLRWVDEDENTLGTGATLKTVLPMGQHTLTASVIDRDGGSASARVTVTIEPEFNQEPAVKIVSPADNSTFSQGENITFVGKATDPEDGDLSGKLKWIDANGNTIGTGPTFETTLPIGQHLITSSITDSGGNSVSIQIMVIIEEPDNQAPTVEIIAPAKDESFTEDEVVTFTGVAIDAEDGDLSTKLVWKDESGTVLGTGPRLRTTFAPGEYMVTASVTDWSGKMTSAQVVIDIQEKPNQTPVVEIVKPANGATVTSGETIVFTGVASDTEDGDLTDSLSWQSNLDGSIGKGNSFDRADLSVGVHTITASVTDSQGLSKAVRITLTFEEPPPPLPPPPAPKPSGPIPVLAHYYAWYDLKESDPGDWTECNISAGDKPLTRYNSDDFIPNHVQMAMGVGLNGFILHWHGPGGRTDRNLKTLMSAVRGLDFYPTVTFIRHYSANVGQPTQQSVIEALNYLLENYATQANFFKLNDKPVIFFEGIDRTEAMGGQTPQQFWATVRDTVDPQRQTIWIGEGLPGDKLSYLGPFDGLFVYKVMHEAYPDDYRKSSRWAAAVRGAGGLWAGTISPGWDDKRSSCKPDERTHSNPFRRERENGAVYRASFNAALESNPDMLLITSFNEWAEGTYIEPSEFYGDRFMQLTKEFVQTVNPKKVIPANPPLPNIQGATNGNAGTAVQPVAAPAPAPPATTQAFTLQMGNQHEYKQPWGAPRYPDDLCRNEWDDKVRMKSYYIELALTNNALPKIADNWSPVFITAKGKRLKGCGYHYAGSGPPTGATSNVTYFTVVDLDDYVSKISLTVENQTFDLCLTPEGTSASGC